MSLSIETPAFSAAILTIDGPLVVVIPGIAIFPANSGFHKSSHEFISIPALGSTAIPILFNVYAGPKPASTVVLALSFKSAALGILNNLTLQIFQHLYLVVRMILLNM